MSKWFYYNEQGEKIEVTGGQLKGLAKTGRITPGTLVETEDGKKAPAKKVKGLTFIAAAPSKLVVEPAQVNEIAPFALSVPEENNPFTAVPLGEMNPFVTDPFAEESSIAENPFTASKPVIEEEPIKKAAENFSAQEFEQLIEQSHKEEQFHKSNPFTASVTTTPVVARNPFIAPMQEERDADAPEASHAETVSLFSSIIALLLVILLCGVVGWVIWWLLGTTGAIPTHVRRETEFQETLNRLERDNETRRQNMLNEAKERIDKQFRDAYLDGVRQRREDQERQFEEQLQRIRDY